MSSGGNISPTASGDGIEPLKMADRKRKNEADAPAYAYPC